MFIKIHDAYIDTEFCDIMLCFTEQFMEMLQNYMMFFKIQELNIPLIMMSHVTTGPDDEQMHNGWRHNMIIFVLLKVN